MKKKLLELGVAALLVIGAIWLVGIIDERYAYMDWRYRLHQKIHTYAAELKGKPLKDHNTIVVLIGDNEFWKGNYSGRLPLNKDNLGQLLLSLSKLNPRVIALDFNFCAQTADGSVLESDIYKDETQKFVDDVKIAAKGCTIVLPKFLRVVWGADGPEYFVELPNKFDAIDPNLDDIARFGHINLTNDFRVIPMTVVTNDGNAVDSFSQAIVKAFYPLDDDSDSERDAAVYYCGAYMNQGDFWVHSADQIMNASDAQLGQLREEFAGKIVIVGAAWSKYAAHDPIDTYTPTDLVDSNYGPAGNLPAVFMHANWVESILAERTGRKFSDSWRWVIEFIIGLVSFLLFRGWVPGGRRNPRLLLGSQILFFPIVAVFWIMMSYVGFQNFGLFIDPFPGLVGALFALVDRAGTKVWEWRKTARNAESAQSM